MSKDPAILFYFNDWHGGTVTFSRFLKGCYMDLLHAQFNSGGLSIDEIKTVLGSDFGSSWPTLQKKFKIEEDGLYYNKRLLFEKNRRQEFKISQSEKSKKRWDNPSISQKEIENENKNEFEFFTEKLFANFRNIFPGTKRGLLVEFRNFKRHLDWKEVISELIPALEIEIEWRLKKVKSGDFIPEWKHLQTWINQRCWEQELENIKIIPQQSKVQIMQNTVSGAGNKINESYKNQNGEQIPALVKG